MSFGRLEKPSGHRPMSDINVTPLVDVMLVLLVIFILAAPLLTTRLELELPKSGVPAAVKAQEPDAVVSVGIDAAGQLYWDEEAIDMAMLQERLRAAARVDPATELHLRADTEVPYGQVVLIIGVAQKEGLSRIGFVADPSTGKPLPESARKP